MYYCDLLDNGHAILILKIKSLFIRSLWNTQLFYYIRLYESHYSIELLLSQYLKNCRIKYIPIAKWYGDKEINRINFDGNCTMLIILLVHIISLSNRTAKDTYKITQD